MNFELQSVELGHVTSAGLQFPAYIWSVDAYADFTPIQKSWADTWNSLKCLRMIVDRVKDDTSAQFHVRQAVITHRFSEPGMSELARLENQVAGHIPNDSVIWKGISNTNVTVLGYVDSKRVMGHPAMRDIVTRVLLDALRHSSVSLQDTGHAQGLANAMWHSIRIDQAPDSDAELPDDVNEAFFYQKDILAQPFATFQFEENFDGTFAQLWFIEHIMKDGGL